MATANVKTSQWYRDNIPGFPKKATVAKSTTAGVLNVFLRKYRWDANRKMDTESSTMIGKVIDNEKYLPIDEYNRLYRRGGRLRTMPKVKEIAGFTSYEDIEKEVSRGLKRHSLGATPIFVETARAIGLIEDLLASKFEEVTVSTALSLACHWLSARTNVFRKYQDWSRGRHLPFPDPLSPKDVGEFAYELGLCNDKMNDFFARRIARAGENEVMYVDSTRISTSAQRVEERAKGLTKQKTIEDQVGSVVLLGRQSHQPLMMRLFAGDVPDITTFDDIIKRMNEYGTQGWKTAFVADKGYNSLENQSKLLDEGKHFLMACKTNFSYVQDAIVEAAKLMEDPNRALDEKGNVRGARIDRSFVFNGKHYNHHLYVYYDREMAQSQLGAFFEKVNRFINACDINDESYKKHPLSKFVELVTDESGRTKILMNGKTIAEETRYYGYMADVSSWKMDISEAYQLYQERQCIENFFKVAKQYIDFDVARSHSSTALNGRHFIAFLAMSIAMHIMHKLVENQTVPESSEPLNDTAEGASETKEVSDESKSNTKDNSSPKKRGRRSLKAKLAPRKVFFSDVVNSTQSIVLQYSTRTKNFWLSEVTNRQHEIAALCGVPNAYKDFHPYEPGKI